MAAASERSPWAATWKGDDTGCSAARAALGVAVGGWLADRWSKLNLRGRICISAIGMSLIVLAIFGVGRAGTLEWAVASLILFGLGWGFFDCNNMPILAQIVRSSLRATGYGIMNFVSISCGGLADWGRPEARRDFQRLRRPRRFVCSPGAAHSTTGRRGCQGAGAMKNPDRPFPGLRGTVESPWPEPVA
jgi:hypothetical protein